MVKGLFSSSPSALNDASSLVKEEDEMEVVRRWAVLMVPMRLWDELSTDF